MIRRLLGLLVLLCATLSVWAQDPRTLKQQFVDAEYFFINEDYEQALNLYLNINTEQPENYNVVYRVGLCYLHIPFETAKAIPYLEKAVQHINPNYNEGSYTETMADPESFYFLGYAYHLCFRFDEAMTAYTNYKSQLDVKNLYYINKVDNQIAACKVCKRMIKNPIHTNITNLGSPINSAMVDFNPCVSADDSLLIYTRVKPKVNKSEEGNDVQSVIWDNRILMCRRQANGEWGEPQDVTDQIHADGTFQTISLAPNGKTLYLFRDNYEDGGVKDNDRGALYYSRWMNNSWSGVTKLQWGINTLYNESHVTVSANDKLLCFTSDRKEDNLGGIDIYYCTKEAGDSVWSAPQNIGSTINTPFDEEAPTIVNDTILVFSSEGHSTMGDYDLFYSKRTPQGWSMPIQLQSPINTPADDVFFIPVLGGRVAYHSAERRDSGTVQFGAADIYRLDAFINYRPDPRLMEEMDSLNRVAARRKAVPTGDSSAMVTMQGLIRTADGSPLEAPLSVQVVDIATNAVVASFTPDASTGKYNCKLPVGNYTLKIAGSKYTPLEQAITIVHTENDTQAVQSILGIVPAGAVLAMGNEPAQPTSTIIDGQLITPDGSPLHQPTMVMIVDANTDSVVLSHMPNLGTGKYTSSLAPGKYKVRVLASGYDPLQKEFEVAPNSDQHIDLKSYLVAASGTASQPKNVFVDGRVTAANGSLLYAVAKIDITDVATGAVVASTTSDLATGKYTASLPAGNYKIKVQAANFESSEQDLVIPPTQALPAEVKTALKAIPVVAAVAESTAKTAKEYTHADTTYAVSVMPISIEGHVTASDNKDLESGITVSIFDQNTNKEIAKLHPAADGSYNTSLAPGNYRVVTQGGAYSAVEQLVYVPQGHAGALPVNTKLIPKTVSSGQYFAIKAVFFDFNSADLSRDAQIELERLYVLMNENPSLNLEVLGHTDSKGNAAYNKTLSVKRAKAVAGYLKSRGIEPFRFVSKGVGAEAHIAINENEDGSDNAEGRKLNRRVEIKVLRTDNMNIVSENIPVPDHLAYKEYIRYSVQVVRGAQAMSADDEIRYKQAGLPKLEVLHVGNEFVYYTGDCRRKSDAVVLLNKVQGAGFASAEITDYFKTNRLTNIASPNAQQQPAAAVPANNISISVADTAKHAATAATDDTWYTIQLCALKSPSKKLQNDKRMSVYSCSDSLTRYSYGRYNSIEAARADLQKVLDWGYADAFVANGRRYMKLECQCLRKGKR